MMWDRFAHWYLMAMAFALAVVTAGVPVAVVIVLSWAIGLGPFTQGFLAGALAITGPRLSKCLVKASERHSARRQGVS